MAADAQSTPGRVIGIGGVFLGAPRMRPMTRRRLSNYIVDDLDAILAKITAHGVPIDPQREEYDYGRFAWIYDPDGNKIELWQPRGNSLTINRSLRNPARERPATWCFCVGHTF